MPARFHLFSLSAFFCHLCTVVLQHPANRRANYKAMIIVYLNMLYFFLNEKAVPPTGIYAPCKHGPLVGKVLCIAMFLDDIRISALEFLHLKIFGLWLVMIIH